MKKLTFLIIVLAMLLAASWAEAYDLRQYPSAGRGVVIMGSDIPPSWFLDVWINPVMVEGRPQGKRSFVLVPHPSYGQRSKEVEVGHGVGAVTAHVEAWEWDRAGNRIVVHISYPVVSYIGQVPVDYAAGYYWVMNLGLYELGVQQWPAGGYSGYGLFFPPPLTGYQRW